jgi:diadenosine tetraphosphate (Ap4A) HIT family hydrolase
MTKKKTVNRAHAGKRARYAETLDAISNAGFCPFCEEHLAKHHSEPILFRTPHWLVTRNAWPYDGAVHHFLLISRLHVEKAEKLPKEAWPELGRIQARLARAYRLSGSTLFMRSGDTDYTGSSVHHLHAQIVSGGKRSKTAEKIQTTVGYKKGRRA